MMSKSHNKKRNIGIIYELLLRYISAALVEDRKSDAQKALNIIEKRFDKSTEIYKEFRLFNALAKTTVSDTPIAAAILTEAKSASRRCNMSNLDKEKSLLIRDINHTLKDSRFYHRRIPEYKVYATIQTLLNDWRLEDTSDLSKVVQFEGKIVEWLLREKNPEIYQEGVSEDVDSLVVKLMTEKFNKRYGGSLNREQKRIIKSYVFSANKSDSIESIADVLLEIKNQTINECVGLSKSTKNEFLLEKVNFVIKKLDCVLVEEIDDKTISKFLTISKLKEELLGEENV